MTVTTRKHSIPIYMTLLGFADILKLTPTEQRWFMEFYYSSMLTRKELDETIRQFMKDVEYRRLTQAKNYMKRLANERKGQKRSWNNQSHLGKLERSDSQDMFGFEW